MPCSQPGLLRGFNVRALMRATLAGFLCASLLLPADVVAAAPATRSSRKPANAAGALTPEQRTLHALNRLTFGPRPGEVARVDRLGLEAWFQQQLHPESVPDLDLERRLAQFPAMQLTQAQLAEHFPTPEMLRRYNRGNLILPDDPAERVIYADAALRYQEKKLAMKAAKAGQATPGEEPAAAAALPGTPPAKSPAVGSPVGGGVTSVQDAPSASGAPVIRVTRGPEPVAASDLPETSPAVKNVVLDLPPEARVQRLFAMSPQQMVSLQEALKGPDQGRLYAGMSPEQVEQVAAMNSPERVVGSEALSVRLLRDVYSQRQLQAVMTDFWLNHFNVYLRKNQNEPYLLPAYERDTVLPNALGTFEDLLVATAKSPAMLVYLDNWQSVGPNSTAALRAGARAAKVPLTPSPAKAGVRTPQGINENYARELMELHTLGVKGGYTQQDVIEVAKCFTGWTVDRPAQGGEFLFNANRHEPGPKTVLGHTVPEGGMAEGLEVLHLLATSPATAHFVSLKLAERFVSDTPPPVLIDRMASTFLKTGGDIKAVLTTLFHSPEFWSPAVYRAKVKTPLEFVASALRATDADVSNPVPLVQALDRLGMPLYGMQTPNGYSWQADAWVSSNALLTRMNFALVLSGNRLQGTKLDWPVLLQRGTDDTTTPDPATEQRLEMAVLGQPAAAQTREAALGAAVDSTTVQQQAEQGFRSTPTYSASTAMQPGTSAGLLRVKGRPGPGVYTPASPLATTAGLLLGSPDFQRR